jgi:hypothetical protein
MGQVPTTVDRTFEPPCTTTWLRSAECLILAPMGVRGGCALPMRRPIIPAFPPAEEGSHFHGTEGSLQLFVNRRTLKNFRVPSLRSGRQASIFHRISRYAPRAKQRCRGRACPSLVRTSRNAGTASRPPTAGRLSTDWGRRGGVDGKRMPGVSCSLH